MLMVNQQVELFKQRLAEDPEYLQKKIKQYLFKIHVPLLQSIVSVWNHDRDPAEMLMLNKQVELFKQRLAEDPEYLQKKIKQYLFKIHVPLLQLIVSGWNRDRDSAEILMAPSLVI